MPSPDPGPEPDRFTLCAVAEFLQPHSARAPGVEDQHVGPEFPHDVDHLSDLVPAIKLKWNRQNQEVPLLSSSGSTLYCSHHARRRFLILLAPSAAT